MDRLDRPVCPLHQAGDGPAQRCDGVSPLRAAEIGQTDWPATLERQRIGGGFQIVKDSSCCVPLWCGVLIVKPATGHAGRCCMGDR